MAQDEFRNSARQHLTGDKFRQIDREARDTESWHRECDRRDDAAFERDHPSIDHSEHGEG